MNNFWQKPDLLVLSGSHLYGYSTPSSDEDYLGFVVPPLRVELGMINHFEQKVPSQADLDAGDDTKVYSLKKFLKLLSSTDTQCLEILFAPEQNRKFCSEIGMRIIENRNLFISKALYRRFSGYAYSEFRKAKCLSELPVKQTSSEKQVIDQIRNLFHPDKETIDNIISMLYQDREKVVVSVKNKLGKTRLESVQKHGYSVKNAAHCMRLLMEGIEVLSTGTLTYPFSNENLIVLRKIRAGEYTLEALEEMFAVLQSNLDKAYENSTLQKCSDLNKINDLFLDITEQKGF